MSTVQTQVRRTAGRLSPGMRRAVHSVVDPLLAPVSSLDGIRSGTTDLVGLTFDDGPDPVSTPQVLASLERAGATATFFMLSQRVSRHPEIVRDVVAAGHEVALHGIDHQRLTELSSEEVHDRAVRGKAVLEEVSGKPVRWFRSPHGAQKVSTYRAIRRADLLPVVWTSAAQDWVDQDPADIAPRLMTSLRPGGIALLHDALAGDPREPEVPDPLQRVRGEMTDSVLAALADKGWSGVSVDGLLAAGAEHRTAWFRP
jgi:peptidoglycan/xylan/chitin deacetylase (PgdA/CDA1 family)